MAVTVAGSGSQACTVGSEHTLYDVAVAGTFEFNVDMNPAVALDVFEVRAKKIYKTGGTLRVVYFQTYNGAQIADDVGKVSVPISNALTDSASLRFTIKQTQGTSRTIDWEVLKFA